MFDKILFISFDYHEENKPKKSLAIASLEAYIMKKNKSVHIESYSFNMNDIETINKIQVDDLAEVLNKKFDYVCISFYAWNMRFLDTLFELINQSNKMSKLIAGGYEVNGNTIDKLITKFPEIDHFIIGYAEESLSRIISRDSSRKVVSTQVDNDFIPPIYSDRIITIDSKCTVRLETKRGCPYKCSFCSYKSNDHIKMTTHDIEKVKEELKFLNDEGIKKVNILDPVFTIFNYKEVIEYLVKIKFKPIISLQMKFELFNQEMAKNAKLFDQLKQLNVILEFGLQSKSMEVMSNIERVNDINIVRSVLKLLNTSDINYEVSIIRGLPGETVQSYRSLLTFLKEEKCKNILPYPLTLLSNTKLHTDRNKYNLETNQINGFEYVIASISYCNSEYEEMVRLEEEVLNSKLL